MSRVGRGFPQTPGLIGAGFGELPDSQQVVPNLITATGDVFALVVQATNEVVIALLGSAGSVFSLAVVSSVALDVITQAGSVFSLAITGGDQPTGSADDIRHFLTLGVPV